MSTALTGSPRTPAEPMAFTGGEFAAGAGRAVLLHLVLFLVIAELSSLTIAIMNMLDQPYPSGDMLPGALSFPIFMLIFLVPISLIAAVVGLLPAYLMGSALVRIPSFRTHLLIWCAFGVVFSGVVSVSVSVILHLDYFTAMSTFVGAAFVASSVAIPLAWARTASIALREDRGLKPLPRFRRRRTPATAHR